jgi:dipeptidyl aminopeptidase/acylaminoacyl peptidase
MIGGVRVVDDSRYVFFDPRMQARWDAVTHAFEGERVRLVSAANGFKKFVVRVDGQKDGFVYELVDLETHTASSLGAVYAGGAAPLEVRRITYAAADGMQIPAYLTLPRGVATKNLALIVLAHGGPAARDTADFEWWAQALADQNYAVLRPNYRGSDLDRRFLAAGFGEWGRKMQTDLSDGVRYLAKEGIVDPARVCIVGASYGGYAALAGVTLDPGVYRCAIAVAGISDLKRWLDWVNIKNLQSHNMSQRYWDRFMGVSGPSDPLLDAISPIKHLSAVNVPVLLIHGRDDTVVPFEQSSIMFDALRREKKDVELVTLQHEDHWLSRSETRLQMLQTSVAFLRAHNPPD